MSLPPGFVPIKDVSKAGRDFSIMGTLTYCMEPYMSKGTDYVLHFVIQDDFSGISPIGGQSSIRCKVFRDNLNKFPKPGAVGDMVLLREMTLRHFGGTTEAISSKAKFNEMLIFPRSKIPIPELETAYGPGGMSELPSNGTTDARYPSRVEQIAIIRLHAASVPFLPQMIEASAKKVTQGPKQKFSLIKDLDFSNYYDLRGEVVKLYHPDSISVDLYLSDYTENTCLFLYDHPKYAEKYNATASSRWQGPYGQVTLAIRVWEPHASFIRDNIHEGDMIHVDNAHTKLSQANKLEAALHEDQKFPHKVCIRKITSAKHIAEIEERKRGYSYPSDGGQARQHLDRGNTGVTADGTGVQTKQQSKKELKKLKRQKELKEMERAAEEQVITSAGVNKHIRAAYPDIRLSTVADIIHNPALRIKGVNGAHITLPFINAKYRSRLRVVDFAPTFEDFCRPMSDTTWNPPVENKEVKEWRRDDRWQWAFVLLVEDADVPTGELPERFRLFMSDKEVQCLLKLDAFDMRHDANAQRVRELEQKLFILWGNLFELKKDLQPKGITFPLPSGDARLQNMPFECCVFEYGAEVEASVEWPLGWQRMHKMFNTTVMDGGST